MIALFFIPESLFSFLYVLKATFFRVVSPAPLLVLTLKAQACPRMVTPRSPLAQCTDHVKLTDAHICLSSFWLDQTEPAPSRHSIGPSWSLSLCQLGSGNLCELLRNRQEGEVKKIRRRQLPFILPSRKHGSH